MSKAGIKYYWKNKEAIQEKKRIYRQTPGYRRYALLYNARSRAKRNNLPINISIEDIIIPEFCPILGLKLEHGNKTLQDSSPSIDRVWPDKGYVKGNISIISHRANRMKGDMNPDQLMRLYLYMKGEL